MKPKGLEHLTKDEVVIKIPLSVILKHQQVFAELTNKMKGDPANASKTYASFLCMLPLQVKGRLTSVEKNEIRNNFNL